MELAFVFFALGVSMATAFPWCHLVQLSKGGRVVEMDVIQNFQENTALTVLGDVSKYADVTPTVNLHDYKTGYLALKDINAKVCLLTRFEGEPLSASQGVKGFVTDVSYYKMSEVSEKMSYESVLMTAGPQIAEFCRDYTVKFEKTTAIAEGEEEEVCDSASSMFVERSCIFCPWKN